MTIIWGVLAATVLACAAQGVPVQETRYATSALRLEMRPEPAWGTGEISLGALESAIAARGVQARWVAVVDPFGRPYYTSKHIPTVPDLPARNESLLKQWVDTIHSQGMAAMSWYPLIISQESYAQHPDWRQVSFPQDPPGKDEGWECCVNSGYGCALIEFCCEAIDKFGLDGIWFDGSAFSQIWGRPVPVTCRCESCKGLFRKDTGLALPSKIDWDDPVFRRWVAWRYDVFSRYIGRLAGAIRERHPSACVVLNHYHRPAVPWQSAIPLNPYPADIITGSEATGEAQVDLTARLCRAYGRTQSEVWMFLQPGSDPDRGSETLALVHHALTCLTAGAMPSYGAHPDLKTLPKTLESVSSVLTPRRPFLSAEPLTYAALHISQQTETFYFSRARKGLDWTVEPYWLSITEWTREMMQQHIAPDFVFDAQFTPENLSRYRALLLPMSIALSDEQCKTIAAFVRRGGTVVLGPGAGAADEWGELRASNLLEQAFGFRFLRTPGRAADERVPVGLRTPDGGVLASTSALYCPVELKSAGWETLALGQTAGVSAPALARRRYGRGTVLLSAIDLRQPAEGLLPVFGGDTSIELTRETAAVGEHCLKFVDGPDAPHDFYPDLEMRFPSFGPPTLPTGRLTCAMRLEPGAQMNVEFRNSAPKHGPSLMVGPEGKIWLPDGPLFEVPIGQWFELIVEFRMAGENRTFDLTVNAGGRLLDRVENLPFRDADFDRCDWLVILGGSRKPGVFYIDELKLEAASGADSAVILSDNFESGDPEPLIGPGEVLARALLAASPAPIQADARKTIRMGAFRQGANTIVHLHNLDGAPWRTNRDAGVTLRVREPIREARLALSGRPLPMRRDGPVTIVSVPPVALHEVVVLER